MTLDGIAELERMLAESAAPAPWAPVEGWPELEDARGEWVADVGREAALIVAARNALPALLALARRGLEAEGEPGLHDVRELMADECRHLADNPPESAEGVERHLWRLACETCGDRIEAMDVRVVSRLVLSEGRAP